MKKLISLLLFLPALAWAQCSTFSPNTILTASALNAVLAAPCITGGTIHATTNGRLGRRWPPVPGMNTCAAPLTRVGINSIKPGAS